MKTGTYGISSHMQRDPRLLHDWFRSICHEEALTNYRVTRENGEAVDNPSWSFPTDGTYRWEDHWAEWSKVRYTEGAKDKQWMEEKDRNYLARLAREKQANEQARPDPLVSPPDDESYEKEAVEARLVEHDTTPKTNEVLAHKHLAPKVSPSAGVPGDYLCPITDQIMYEPVIAADGESYEKEAIEAWLVEHDTTPKTNEVLAHKHLLPNKNLRRAIQDFLDKQPTLKASADYYLPYSLKAELVSAIQQDKLAIIQQTLAKHPRLKSENLASRTINAPGPQVNQAKGAGAYPLAASANTTPIYLLPLACEHGSEASLQWLINILDKPLALTDVYPAIRQVSERLGEAGLTILGNGLGYQQADYLKLFKQACENNDKPILRPLLAKAELSKQELQQVLLALPLAQAVELSLQHKELIGETGLMTFAVRCVEAGELGLLQQLIQAGCNVQAVDGKGNSLLHLAAQHNQAKIAHWLIEQGCSEKALNSQGKRPRQVARDNGHAELAERLISAHQQYKFHRLFKPYQEQITALQQEVETLKASIRPL